MKNIELHVHPFFGKNNLKDVIEAMDSTNIDILGLEAYNDSLFPFLIKEARILYPDVKVDNFGIKLPNGKFLLNSGEYNSKENIHVLTTGYSFENNKFEEIRRVIDTALENGAFVALDHPYVDNFFARTASHIPEEMEKKLEELCKEYSDEVALEWNGYCKPWVRRILKTGLNVLGYNVRYHNVNKKVDELSSRLLNSGYNVPVVADTDLHARNKKHLKKMGTARFLCEIDGENGKDIVQSIKKDVFNRKHCNVRMYVDFSHLLGAFCLPILFPGYFEKPRG